MTINSTSAASGPYTGTSAVQSLPFDFHAASKDEIRVEVDGAQWIYFDVVLEDDGTGSVIGLFPNGSTIYIESDPSFAQETDFNRFAPYFPDSLNPPLDRAAIRDIALKGKVDRSLIAPIGAGDPVTYFREIGFKGADSTVAGPASNSHANITALRAAKRSDQTYTLRTDAGPRLYNFVEGNFSALITPDFYQTYDFVKLDDVPATQGALVLDRGTQRSIADFGGIGADNADDTAAVQAAANWASAVGRKVLVIGTKGSRFVIEKAVIKTLDQFEGIHKRLSIFQARKLANPPSGYYGLFEIDAGPVIECDFRDFAIEGLTPDGTANPGQMGLYAFARRPTNPAEFPQGGLWYSTFTRVDIRNFVGHTAWFRGGNVDDPNVPGTYSFLLPHQFLRFEDCDWVRGGAATATCAVLSGQCGQFLFKKSPMGSQNKQGFALSIGREFVGGSREQNLINSNVGLFAGAFVAPGAIYVQQSTLQGVFTAVLTDQANVFIDGCDFETVSRAITAYGGSVQVDGSEFRSAGDFNGNGWLIGSFGANISGKSNTFGGTTDRITVREDNALRGSRLNVEMIGAYDAGKTVGSWLSTGVGPNGSMVLGSSRLARCGGAMNACVNIESGFLPGEWHEGRVEPGANPVIFLASDKLDPPRGLLILRGGDTFRTTLLEDTNKYIFEATKAELTSGTMPTTGWYLAGEFVRNSDPMTIGTGAVTWGWYRLTTGNGHVSGTDWRTLQVTGV